MTSRILTNLDTLIPKARLLEIDRVNLAAQPTPSGGTCAMPSSLTRA